MNGSIAKFKSVALGAVLCGTLVAALHLSTLYLLIRVLHWGHWKFGGEGYLSLSLGLAPFIYGGSAGLYLLLGSVVCCYFKRIRPIWFVYGGIFLGLLIGGCWCFATKSDLNPPKSELKEKRPQ
jgi:hypothetical protein